ncbi:MAG TPA: DUF4118 domain-containing protein, partial [Blastocatellia bacterium]|nr:DUF4118 domain-containing protein [Blastocatellia bacterium]
MLRSRSPVLSYVISVLSVVACTLLRGPIMALMGLEMPGPFSLVYPAVLLSSYVGGLGPGLVATALSTITSIYFFVGESPAGGISHSNLGVRVFTYLVVCVATSILAEAGRRAKDAERKQREWLQVILNSIGDAVIATDS